MKLDQFKQSILVPMSTIISSRRDEDVASKREIEKVKSKSYQTLTLLYPAHPPQI